MPRLGLFPPLYTEINKGHGRVEERSIKVASILATPIDFPGAKQIFQIERSIWRGKKFTQEIIFGITSHSAATANPKILLQLNRGHWSVENKSHWIRDVVFSEDLSQIRTGTGPAAFAVLRNTAISLIKLAQGSSIACELRSFSRNNLRTLRAIGIATF